MTLATGNNNLWQFGRITPPKLEVTTRRLKFFQTWVDKPFENLLAIPSVFAAVAFEELDDKKPPLDLTSRAHGKSLAWLLELEADLHTLQMLPSAAPFFEV